MAMGREAHQPSLSERLPMRRRRRGPTPVEAMAYRLATPEGKKPIACANRCRRRSSASSSLCWASVSFCCMGSTRCARVEPCDRGLEPEADVHLLLRLVR